MATPWWDMTGAFTLYGVVGAGLINVGVSRLTLRSARDQGREARSHELRASAYVEILRMVKRSDLIIERLDAGRPYEELPGPWPDDDLINVDVLVEAHGTDRVRALTEQWNLAFRAFVPLQSARTGFAPAVPGAIAQHQEWWLTQYEKVEAEYAQSKEAAEMSGEKLRAQVRSELHPGG